MDDHAPKDIGAQQLNDQQSQSLRDHMKSRLGRRWIGAFLLNEQYATNYEDYRF